MPMSYDVPVSLPRQLLRALPNRYLRPPSLLFMRDNVALRTILLVTTTHVHNSELWLEYVQCRPATEDCGQRKPNSNDRFRGPYQTQLPAQPRRAASASVVPTRQP